MALDKSMIAIILAANAIAASVLYQRLDSLGYTVPFKHHIETLYEKLGLYHAAYTQCGQLQDTMFILTSSRVVHPDGVRPGAITIRGGKIVDVADQLPAKPRYPVVDYKYAVISPGVIDVHVHMNEPGREHWEGMETGTAAAAAGGSTTVIDMPLNSHPCTTTAQLLQQKMKIAEAKAKVNVGFWAGITPENAHQEDVLWGMLKAGALGFKAFLAPSGMDDFRNVSRSDVAGAMHFLLSKGAPFFVHAELVTEVQQAEESPDPRKYASYLATRPASFEEDAAALLLDVLLQEHIPPTRGFFLHIAHLGDAKNVEGFRAVKRRLPLSVETCPHYLLFSAEEIADGDTKFKCAPPLRDEQNRRGLLEAVAAGDIDIISSDHSPAPAELKQVESGDFMKAWGGISGLQYLLPAAWTAVREAGVDLLQLSHLLSTNPAHLAGLPRKGLIAAEMDADLVVWDPEAAADTSVGHNRHQHKLSPYTDMKLKGRVLATFVKGHKVFDEQQGVFDGHCGQVLRKKWLDVIRERKQKKSEL
ncbi:allantoinase [Scenedesmus sp. NREL 46B-D3]|nr:allantoinase [Scenedesmus sp. NREL 46B-D3]